jgi:MSHA biogenesis protein MshI
MWSLLKREAGKPKGLSCVSFNTDGVAFVHATSVSGHHLEIEHCTFLPSKDRYHQAIVLGKYVKVHNLAGADCACVLTPGDYRLLLLDAPKVPEAELKQATRFLIKDLIDFPIQDIAVDFFEVPTLVQKEKIYVVAVQIKLLKKISRLTEQAGLKLCYIDITELALRNLLVLWKDKVDGLALLFIHSDSMYVVIVHDSQVCFARQISTGIHPQLEQSSISLEALIEKFQQTFDYYQAQMAKDPPSKLLLAPMIDISDQFLKRLQDNLPVKVERLDLNAWLTLKEPLDAKLQARCLIPLAEALQMKEIMASLGESK